tara:strand:- start:436 stop:999 length:564 start_codon:yes stop_codon:yes gene_type:complete
MEYGNKHREERRKKKERLGDYCEITGEEAKGSGELHSHHSHPRSLDFMDAGDMQSNYMLILEEYHKLIHKVCDVSNKNLLLKRRGYAKKVWNDTSDHEAHDKLREADEILIPDFINKMMDRLPHYVREKVVRLTLINAFKTNRDLKIQERTKDQEIERLNAEIERLRSLMNKNIIEIVDHLKERKQG